MKKIATFWSNIELFLPKQQPESYEFLPPEFEEQMLFWSENKKGKVDLISIVLSPYLTATFEPSKLESTKLLDSKCPAIVNGKSINIIDIKFNKKNIFPLVTVEATFDIPVNDNFIAEFKKDEQLMQYQSKNGLFVDAISFKWDIDFWGTDGLDLSVGEYSGKAFMIEGLL